MENKSSKVNKCNCRDNNGDFTCLFLSNQRGVRCGCPCHTPTPDTENFMGDLRWKDTKEKVIGEVLVRGDDNWLSMNAQYLEMWNGKEWIPVLPDTIEEAWFGGGADEVRDRLEQDTVEHPSGKKYCAYCEPEDTEEQLKCKHLKCGCGKYLIGDSELELDGICHRPYLPCYIIDSQKNENEDSWTEELYDVIAKCRFEFKYDREINYLKAFIKSLISKAKEEAYMEGAQDGFVQARQGVRAQTRADTKAEFIEKIKRFPTHEYEVDEDEGITSGEVINKDDLLTSLTKE